MGAPEFEAPTVVIDTNVVLDWLVFRNPACAAMAKALTGGQMRWIATRAMRDELSHVLARGHLDAWAPDLAAVTAHWDALCRELASPDILGQHNRLRCSDPDDQMFIDLAVANRARWLLSRDRAVLKLARRLRAHGVEVLPPERWAWATPD